MGLGILLPLTVNTVADMARWSARTVLATFIILSVSYWASVGYATPAGPPEPELRNRLIAAINQSNSFEDRFHAEVWLLDMSYRLQKRIPDANERLELLRTVHQEATQAGLPPEMVLALIQVESNFKQYAISSAGAQGLMQIMPFWLDEIGRPGDNLFHIRTNLRMGCTILRYYLDKSDGDRTKALARYNGSAGKTWYPNRVYKALRTSWRR